MPETYPPFMNSTGLVSKILDKIKEAQTPDRFTQDYLANTLGFSGGSAKPFIPLVKRLGLLASDGTPTERYKAFRNPDRTKGAMAEAVRQGYADLFRRNENVHTLDKASLRGLVMELTGLDKDASTLNAIVGTFQALKSFADFGVVPTPKAETKDVEPQQVEIEEPGELRFSYTIYLNLPNTSEIAVFNAIFKSLRENLMKG